MISHNRALAFCSHLNIGVYFQRQNEDESQNQYLKVLLPNQAKKVLFEDERLKHIHGVKIAINAQMYWSLGAMGWDYDPLKPSKKKLMELGMTKDAEALWSPQKGPPGPY